MKKKFAWKKCDLILKAMEAWNQKPMMPLGGEDWCRVVAKPARSRLPLCRATYWTAWWKFGVGDMKEQSAYVEFHSLQRGFLTEIPAHSHHAALEFDRMRKRNETSTTTVPQSISHQLAAPCGVPVLHSTNCSYTFPKYLLSTSNMAERS